MLSVPLLLAAALASAPAPALQAASRPASVLDLFNRLAEEDVVSKEGKYVIQGQVGEDLPVDLDLKNGYLTFSDEGTGGGTRTVEAALFVTAGGRRLLAVHENIFDGVASAPRFALWESKGSGLVAVEGALPKLGIDDFVIGPGDREARARFARWLELAGVLFTLPRQGTTLVARLDLATLESRVRLDATVPAAEKDEILAFARQRCYQEIERSPFDAKKGTFSVGRKKAPAGRK